MTIYFRRHLPQYHLPNVHCFITFRLAGSLPEAMPRERKHCSINRSQSHTFWPLRSVLALCYDDSIFRRDRRFRLKNSGETGRAKIALPSVKKVSMIHNHRPLSLVLLVTLSLLTSCLRQEPLHPTPTLPIHPPQVTHEPVTPPGSSQPASNTYGIFSFPPGNERAWQALADLGASWVRLQFRMGEEDPTLYTRVLREGYGLWLTIYPRDPQNVADPENLVRTERGGFPPVDDARYRELVTATLTPLVAALRAAGKNPGDWLVVQLGNETIPSDVLSDQPLRFWHGTSDEYLHTLALTYDAVKRMDPGIPVAISSLSSEAMEAILAYENQGEMQYRPVAEWAERLLTEGQGDWADIHLYHSVESIPAKVAWVQKHWDGPLAASEIGGPDNAVTEAYSEAIHTADLQARLQAALDAGVQRVFWTTLIEQPAFGERYNPMALITAEGLRRPAFAAYQQIIQSGVLQEQPPLPATPPLLSAASSLLLGTPTGEIIRPLLGVNIGPIPAGDDPANADLTEAYQHIGVTLIRTHDYYGPMDMAVIYPDQNADPADPASYDFTASDEVFRAILAGGFEPYLRIGDSWNVEGLTRRAPAHPENWTRAAVEVVRHYRAMAAEASIPLRYVEIWNEPDGRFWDGTPAEFFALFAQTARAIKAAFPELHVGGPGFTPAGALTPQGNQMVSGLLDYLQAHQTPLDFLSWHIYANDPGQFTETASFYRQQLDTHGYAAAESHITEWNTAAEHGNEPSAGRLRFSAQGAALLSAAWIGLQQQGVDVSTFYRGPDPDINAPHFFGMFYANGHPKPIALAFSLWAGLVAHPQQVPVTGATDGLWLLAGQNSDGEIALLIANPTEQRFSWQIVFPDGAPAQHFILQTVSEASDQIQTAAAGPVVETGANSVQLVTLSTQ